ncbi:hypothetical protein HAN_2g229 (nucleomorph) [Hemiselmis andersenii]|uniref:Nascent polypeptide-associated complex subunit beta n=1 Tax=Hemiselmis andersenii TaxID=464988 RepID=A9BKQ0_HEMAN|nr:hypothetical protein HAN_2g229 [Hemiselmis andersenii]ABW98055.1 hypothetical protein HAN_2g229 [Hemiselmis andersenii]|mmetsp:Transcript_23510/g.54669  ORF Transcript_23510/g.54669 Transcript_23510/m.54669 type:complete len:91 (+) Transcript_23510:935-1207(+)
MDSNKFKKEEVLEDFHKNNQEIDGKMSRGEKRTRKALENFSYQKQNGFYKVMFQKSINSMFAVFQPSVFKNSHNGSFLIFGEAIAEKNFQ